MSSDPKAPQPTNRVASRRMRDQMRVYWTTRTRRALQQLTEGRINGTNTSKSNRYKSRNISKPVEKRVSEPPE